MFDKVDWIYEAAPVRFTAFSMSASGFLDVVLFVCLFVASQELHVCVLSFSHCLPAPSPSTPSSLPLLTPVSCACTSQSQGVKDPSFVFVFLLTEPTRRDL